MIVNINVRNNGDGYSIGSVVAPAYMTDNDVRVSVDYLWNMWREEVPHPDSDSDFILWLIQKGWQEDKNEYITMFFD
jgi:hypothetical protein